MVRSLAAFAIFALLGASVIALPGFAPNVKASEATVLAKADCLPIFKVPADCTKQVWPDLAASCPKDQGSNQKIAEARLVATRR